MINVYNAEDILAVKKVGDLFANDVNSLKKDYRLLVKIWHPDVNSDKQAGSVMNYINTLYEHANLLIKNNQWEVSNQAQYISNKDEVISINFQLEKNFELGKYYVCSNKVVYVIDKSKENLANNAVKMMASFSFADDEMEREIRKLLPKVIHYYLTKDGKYVIIEIEKTNDLLPLSEILKHYNGIIPHKHVAWIMSRLNNLICYLQWSGLAHNGISLDTCFISPMYHSVVVYGGWWYARPLGESLKATSKDVYDIIPFSVKNKKVSSILTDIESVKALGRQLLGDRSGYRMDNTTPKSFTDFLSKTNAKNGFENYNNWSKVLHESYGVRKFIPMEINENELYTG